MPKRTECQIGIQDATVTAPTGRRVLVSAPPGGRRSNDAWRAGLRPRPRLSPPILVAAFGLTTRTMRPLLLNPLFAPVASLPGVGPKQEKNYQRLLSAHGGTPRLIDLLWHLPTGAIDRRARPKLRDVQPDSIVTVAVVIDRHRRPPPRSRAPYRIDAHDETGVIALIYFHAYRPLLERLYPVGERRYISGKAEIWDHTLQMVHPDRIVDEAGFATLPLIDPIYPLREGLSLGHVGKTLHAALGRLPRLPEWQDRASLTRHGWPSFEDALTWLHRPRAPADVLPQGPAWSRLAYDELLAGQLALALTRAHMRRPPGRAHVRGGAFSTAVIGALPFSLTSSQRRAVEEIVADLGKPQRMLRLLQGDVGSGKTVVALLAAAQIVDAGGQVALMAPTEILARQHLATLSPWAQAAGIRIGFLSGRERGRERTELLDRLAAGDLDLLAGTHALFQKEVAFKDLRLAIVDEQHRFGVHQRLALTQKGDAVDVLVMTATPIPRTLALTYFGDMDVSELREKPAGRQPIDTRMVSLERLEDLIVAVGRALVRGERVYWVCPQVEESEQTDLAAAQERCLVLKQRFGEAAVDLVHGRLKTIDKDAVMARFASGQCRLLVATTVIEVGVDVPEATVMVIEHAERFGLAQLHQLRGRVGRGAGHSTCLLAYRAPLSSTARARLTMMRQTQDGFRIAEEDLRLRGEGDLLGKRQSGTPGFKVVRLEVHGQLIEPARQQAASVLARDPTLASESGEALRHLLYLFEQDEAIRLLRAG
jgi:ATP-dependent DNA helicase RecG